MRRSIESTAGSRTHPRVVRCARSVSALTPAGLHSTLLGSGGPRRRGVRSLHPNHPNTADVPACPRRAQEDPAQRAPPLARRPDGRVRRLGHAGRILRHRRRAHGGAHARRAVRRQPHGRDRDRRRRCAGGGPAHHLERRREARGRPDPVFGADDAAGHVRRRCADVSGWRTSTSCWSSTRRTSSRTSTGSPSTSGRGRRRGGEHELALRAARAAGAGRAGRPADADRRRSRRRIKYYWFTTGEVAGVRVHDLAHRLYRRRRVRSVRRRPRRPSACGTRSCRPARAPGVVPAGLGARDTLRLEAAMRLYGNDMDETTTVVEADLGWIVGWKKDEFIGARRAAAAEGRGRAAEAGRVRDARSRDRRATATTCIVDGAKAGVVTSGTQTPFLKKAIGMAYLPADRAAAGHGVRGRRSRPARLAAAVVPMPFYKRAK